MGDYTPCVHGCAIGYCDICSPGWEQELQKEDALVAIYQRGYERGKALRLAVDGGRAADYHTALNRAAYALFQIKRMAPEAITDFARQEHEAACKILDSEPSPHEPRTPKNCRPLDEYVAELEQDPVMKAALDKARAELRAEGVTEPTHLSAPFLADFVPSDDNSWKRVEFYCDGAYLRGWREGQQALSHPAPDNEVMDGWRPIESAPKDGTLFLSFGLGHGNRIFSYHANEKPFPMFSLCKWRWHDSERDEPVGEGLFRKVPCRVLEGWDVEWSYQPTHWKSLPNAPQ